MSDQGASVLADLLARVILIREALEDGDRAYAAALVADLEDELSAEVEE